MVLSQETVLQGTVDELARFEQLIRGLDEGEWSAPSRCAGWTVADVAAHVTGTLAAIAAGQLDTLTDPAHTQLQVEQRRGRTPREVADELRAAAEIGIRLARQFDAAAWAGPAPAGIPGTLGEGVEAIWYDTYVHGEDIRAAIGRQPERGPGLTAAVAHVADLLTREGWGPAILHLDGMPAFAVGGGGGPTITGDPLGFVLVATGRADPSAFGLDETVNVYR